MRKHLFYLAAAIVAMSSCTESEVVEISQSKIIGFNSFVGNQTRTEQKGQTLETLKEEGNGFYVFGTYKEENKEEETVVFDGKTTGAHVTWGESWGYSPINFWLEKGTYKFAAYAPQLSITPTFNYANNQMTFPDFVTDGKTDLLVAEAAADGIKGSNPRVVNFTFKHALSKVRFTFIDGWRNDVILSITQIKLKQVKSKGTLTTPGNLQGAGAISKNNWQIQNDVVEFEDKTGIELKVLNSKHLFDNFIIPQTIDDIELEFTVSVRNPNNTFIVLDKDKNTVKTITVPLSTGTVTEWIPGNAYNYKLTISGTTFGLKPIQFDVTEVSDWNELDDQDITDGVTNIVTPKNP